MTIYFSPNIFSLKLIILLFKKRQHRIDGFLSTMLCLNNELCILSIFKISWLSLLIFFGLQNLFQHFFNFTHLLTKICDFLRIFLYSLKYFLNLLILVFHIFFDNLNLLRLAISRSSNLLLDHLEQFLKYGGHGMKRLVCV